MPTSATPFPPPPAHYALYDVDVDGPPPPPVPRDASYASFGAQHTTAPWHEHDASGFVYPVVVDDGANADAREEIVACVESACERYARALAECVDAPSKSDRWVNDAGTLLNNAQRVINDAVRPSQAMRDLEYRIEVMIKEKRAVVEALREAVAEGRKAREVAPKSGGR